MFSKQTRLKLLSFYPPFLGAGIGVSQVSDDLHTIEVRMKLHWWNRNVVGTHFGGSLYTMCDPFYMLILLEKLGKEYIIWDKAASIRFKRPSRTTVRAQFQISPQQIQEIRSEVDRIGRKDYTFSTRILGEEGEVVAEVEKLVYVRRKDFVFLAKKGDRRKEEEKDPPRK
jgi:acyl-coenzyme A thioesterase PaaI-like protein